MAVILLNSKLGIPPLRMAAVTRSRLLEYANTGLVEGNRFLRKLTLISAPAGYGKTTMAVEWFNQLDYALAWLSLDEGDNDPSRFVSYLIAAIQAVHPGYGLGIMKMVQSPQPPPMEILFTALLKELEANSKPLILVLDDYHAIKNRAIHQQISFILEHLPQHLHLVVITREDPLIPISRLRADNQLLEIRQENLRFTLDETTQFMLQAMHLNLSATEIQALERRTEGWIAGLQLLGITLQDIKDINGFIREFTGSSRFILDYLMEEVVNRQPGSLRTFLLHTSVLEQLCGPLCDTVTGQSGGSEVLENLEKANMFIVPLDKSRTWYRYHALFAELLRHELTKAEQPTAIAHLHQKASQWFEAEGIIAESIHHALAAKDWVRAAQLIGGVSDGMLRHGEVATLLRWLEVLPEKLIFSQYDLCVTYIWVLLLIGKYEQVKPVLEQVVRLVKPGSVELGQIATAQAYLARCIGDNQGVIETSQLALSLLPETEIAQRSNLLMNLGMVYWQDGRLDEAMPTLVDAQEKASQSANLYAQLTSELFLARVFASQGELHKAAMHYPSIIDRGPQIPVTILAYFDLGFLNYEWNELGQIDAYLQKGLELSKITGNLEFRIAGLILKVYLALAQQDWDTATSLADQIFASAGNLAKQVVGRCIACKAQTALAIGDFKAAYHWLDQNADNMDSHPFYRFINLIRPRLLILEGKKELAAEELGQCYLAASHNHWGYAQVAVRVLQALAAPTPTIGLEYLTDALHRSQPEGYIRTFVDAGIGLVPLLQEAARQGITPRYTEKILDAFGGRKKPLPGHLMLVEALSEREVEVLKLVTAGLSNREIARKLFISPGTAKTHIHNLCGKLGVRNRTEAAMRARELGLA